MFRTVCDPSSGSIETYLTEIRSGSLMFVVCLVGVWQRNFEPVVCVCVYGTNVRELLSVEGACKSRDLQATSTDSSSQTVVPYTHTTGSKLRCQTPIKHTTNISEPLRTSAK